MMRLMISGGVVEAAGTTMRMTFDSKDWARAAVVVATIASKAIEVDKRTPRIGIHFA